MTPIVKEILMQLAIQSQKIAHDYDDGKIDMRKKLDKTIAVIDIAYDKLKLIETSQSGVEEVL